MARTIAWALGAWLACVGVARADGALVLTHLAGESTVTTTLVIDGHVVGSRPGTFVATSRGIVELRLEDVSTPAIRCDDEDGDGTTGEDLEPLAPNTAQRLIAIDEDGTRTEIASTVLRVATQEDSSTISIAAVLGSYVFTLSASEGYACGVHDSGANGFGLYDLETRRAVEVPNDPRIAPWWTALHARTMAAYARILDDLQDGPHPELAAILPTFDAAGNVQTDTIVITFSCYACSDADPESHGGWAPYYSAAHLDTRLPPFLRPIVTATAPERRATRAARPDSVTIGAGTIADAIAARVRGSFTPS